MLQFDYNWLLQELHDVTLISIFARMFLAATLGGIIGMERGQRRRAAGLRTHMLVCMGAALAMITNQYIVVLYGGGDPARLGAQVISGIGFLGVGTIIVDQQQQVRGLTTAAGMWASACMGLALGIGFYSGAVIAGFFIFITITILNKFEQRILSKSRTMEIYAEFETCTDINRIVCDFFGSRISVSNMEIVQPRNHGVKSDGRGAAVLKLRLPRGLVHARVLEDIDSAPGILCVEEIR